VANHPLDYNGSQKNKKLKKDNEKQWFLQNMIQKSQKLNEHLLFSSPSS
jgi:hypothetical protein